MKRKKLNKQVKKQNTTENPTDPTSSLNSYFMCVCGRKYMHKFSLVHHVRRKCTGKISGRPICRWCKLDFKNKGNLRNHLFYMHGVKKFIAEDSDKPHKCNGCNAKFSQKWQLKFHIRSRHFNLLASVSQVNDKEVNQVWFENCLNTNRLMQLRKTSTNSFLLKPIPLNAGVKIQKNKKIVDLRDAYPTGRRQRDEICRFCLKIYRKTDLKKHIDEKHYQLTKHKCNNCNKTFKRSYIYLKHVCHKTRVNGVRHHVDSQIRITRVESGPEIIKLS